MKWISISFVIFIFGLLNIFAPVRGAVQYLFNPIQLGIREFALDINSLVTFFIEIKNIYAQNQELKKTKDELFAENVRLQDLQIENELLKQQLNIKDTQNSNKGFILAQTLGNVDGKLGGFLFIDKGQNHGVSIGDVVVQGGYLVGVVREVTLQRSKVELIVSPTLAVNVSKNASSIEGISQGQYGTTLAVNRVLPSEEVSINDIFVSNGKDGMFPAGFIVGKVNYVSGATSDVMKTVSLNTLVDFNNLTRVFVIPSK